MGAGILVPVIPFLVAQFRAEATMVGLVAVAFSAAQFTASPILGALSDRFGRRPILLVSLFGTAVGYFLFGFATALWMIFVSRLLDGVTGGNISTAQAYIADVTPPEDRAKNFGLIGAAFGLGFIIGPALGGALSHISLQAPAFAAGILSLITCAAAYFFLPESLPSERRRTQPVGLIEINPVRQLGLALERPALRGLLWSVFALQFAFAELQTNFAVFTARRFGLGPAENAWLFAFVGLSAALMQGVVIRKAVKWYSGESLTRFGLAVAAVGFAGIAVVPAAVALLLPIALISIGNGMASPSMTAILSERAGGHEQGFLLGAAQSLRSLAMVLGPAWAGAVFDWIGPASTYWTASGWVLLAMFLAVRALGSSGPARTTGAIPA